MRQYYVYIMSSKSRTLYTGITNALERRVYEHKRKLVPGFTARYNIVKLVYFEETPDVKAAIAREKQVKGWSRAKKIALVESANPTWEDLSADWYGRDEDAPGSKAPSARGSREILRFAQDDSRAPVTLSRPAGDGP